MFTNGLYADAFNRNIHLLGGDPETFAVLEDGMCAPPGLLEHYHKTLIRTGTELAGEPERHVIFANTKSYKLISDGAAFEYTLKNPSKNPVKLRNNYLTAKAAMQQVIEGAGAQMYNKPTVNFNLEYYLKKYNIPEQDDFFWSLVHFGCDPQYNIYSSEYDKMVDAKAYPYRHAGGHIHISSNVVNLKEAAPVFIRLLDITVGQVAIGFSPNPTEENLRQGFYGKPGNMRFQNYLDGSGGVEYRTPSLTVWDDEQCFAMAVTGVGAAFYFLEQPTLAAEVIETYLETAKDNIVNFKPEAARQIIKELELC